MLFQGLFKTRANNVSDSLLQLSVSVDAGDERGLVEKEGATSSPFHSRIPLAADTACRPLTFSIVLTDQEPGTGYFSACLGV